MSKSVKYLILVIFGFAFIAVAFVGGKRWAGRSVSQRALQQANEAQNAARAVPIVKTPPSAATSTPKAATTSTPQVLTGAFNLDVPFVPQAPKKNWDVYHEDYCEEAALLGMKLFLSKKTESIDAMDAELNAARDWQVQTFGYFESTPLSEVSRIAKEFFKFKKVTIIENPTYEQIHAHVAAGRPVVLPTNGKLLFNPHFKNGGPGFHMLTVRGFTADGDFITNDPGTQYGENYVYKKDVLMKAIHDWDHSATEKLPALGTPRALVLE